MRRKFSVEDRINNKGKRAFLNSVSIYFAWTRRR